MTATRAARPSSATALACAPTSDDTTRDADAQVADMPRSRRARGLAAALNGAAIGVGAIVAAWRNDAPRQDKTTLS